MPPATRKRRSARRAPRPRLRRAGSSTITRREFSDLIALLNDRAEFMDALRHDLVIQFKRTAEIQAEVDEIKRLLSKLIAPG